MVHLNSKEYIELLSAKDKLDSLVQVDDFLFFKKRNNESQATPLKIVIGEYEISITGDDSVGALPELYRTSLSVFDKDGNNVFDRYSVGVKDIIEAILFVINK